MTGCTWHQRTAMRRCVLLLETALLSVESSVMPPAFNRIEALRCAEWGTEPWINSEPLMAPNYVFIVTTVRREIWFGFACGAIWYHQKALEASVKRLRLPQNILKESYLTVYYSSLVFIMNIFVPRTKTWIRSDNGMNHIRAILQ